MFTDLFSSLDGTFSFWSWSIPILFSLIVFNMTWHSQSQSILNNFISMLWNNKYSINLIKLMLLSLIMFIIINNFLGLVPFMFSTTSSLWLNSSMALLLWGSILLSGWFMSPIKSAGHLAPAGAPAMLMPFLIIIETISILIRPLTLTVRLVANISAGHIVLTLIASCLSMLIKILPMFSLMILSIFYLLFEFFVSVIQGYIFTLLISLYASEHP